MGFARDARRDAADGARLVELVDVLMAIPPNIVNAHVRGPDGPTGESGPPLVILDPRVPGQRPDSALGSVLGRPAPDTLLAAPLRGRRRRSATLPAVSAHRTVPSHRRRPGLAGHDARRGARPPVLRRSCQRRRGPVGAGGSGVPASGGGTPADRRGHHVAADADPPRVALWRARPAGTIGSTRRRDWSRRWSCAGRNWSRRRCGRCRRRRDIDGSPAGRPIRWPTGRRGRRRARRRRGGRAVNGWQRDGMRRWRPVMRRRVRCTGRRSSPSRSTARAEQSTGRHADGDRGFVAAGRTRRSRIRERPRPAPTRAPAPSRVAGNCPPAGLRTIRSSSTSR